MFQVRNSRKIPIAKESILHSTYVHKVTAPAEWELIDAAQEHAVMPRTFEVAQVLLDVETISNWKTIIYPAFKELGASL